MGQNATILRPSTSALNKAVSHACSPTPVLTQEAHTDDTGRRLQISGKTHTTHIHQIGNTLAPDVLRYDI